MWLRAAFYGGLIWVLVLLYRIHRQNEELLAENRILYVQNELMIRRASRPLIP